MRKILLIISIAAAFGCVAAIPYELTKDVDRNITFENVMKDPDTFMGKKVVFGGEIIETRVLKEGTQVEILQKPLDYYDVPLVTDESQGRFLAMFKEFLDPQVFKSGRRVTIVGEVEGKQTLPLGGTEYIYPSIRGQHIHLWPHTEEYYYYPHFDFGIGLYRWYPY